MSEPEQVEAMLISWLGGLGYDAYADVPRDKPPEFVTVERSGGPRDIAADRPMVSIQYWAETRAAAASAAHRLAAELRGLPGNNGVTKCTINSITNFPGENKEPRYQIVCDLVVGR